MPQIVITTDDAAADPGRVLLKERVAPSDLESDHFSAQLVERVGWAVVDADALEQRLPAKPRQAA
jgi:hypothetical protein